MKIGTTCQFRLQVSTIPWRSGQPVSSAFKCQQFHEDRDNLSVPSSRVNKSKKIGTTCQFRLQGSTSPRRSGQPVSSVFNSQQVQKDRDNLSVPSSRANKSKKIGTTCQFRLQGSRSTRRMLGIVMCVVLNTLYNYAPNSSRNSFWTSSPLKMGPKRWPETSVTINQRWIPPCRKPEIMRSRIHFLLPEVTLHEASRICVTNQQNTFMQNSRKYGSLFAVLKGLSETKWSLTYTGPCIVIYSYNNSRQDALFLNFILVKNSTWFWTDLLSIIRSLNP